MAGRFKVEFFDENFNRKAELGKWAQVWWEYNRVGGCGQGVLSLLRDADNYEPLLRPQTSVRFSVGGQLRYQGRILKVTRAVRPGSELITATFYGYLSQLSKVIVRGSYQNTEISQIVLDILDNYVVPYTDVSYSASDIQATDYVVQSLSLNHTAQDAVVLLAQLAGNVEWGVDRNRKFFFRQQDGVVRKVLMLGRDLTEFQEERSFENVVNVLNVFGSAGYISSPESGVSQDVFGRAEANRFESAISEPSDANRLGAVVLKGSGGVQRAISASYIKDDEFLEQSLPVGAVAIQVGNVPLLKKYGASSAARPNNKYGASTPRRRNKYGNFTQDQLGTVRYTPAGKGLSVSLSLQQLVPTLATQQKRIEYEINELQRR